MKHIVTFLFCMALLTGCMHGRHEAVADGHMVNNGKAPRQTVSINNLYPDELPDTGKVTTYTYGYTPYRKYNHNRYRYKRYTPRKWY